jgi:hypothetical protein
MRTRRSALGATLLALALVACSDTTGSITDVNAVRLTPASLIGNNGNGFGNEEPISVTAAPPLQRMHAEFWAVQGKQRSVTISYLPAPGEVEGKKFLVFTVPSKAQLVRPDGRLLARNDSVRISVDVVPGKLQANFSPEGLVFAGSYPAQLGISFYYGDTRGRPTDQLAMWYLGDSAEQIPSVVDGRGWMISGQISHFSNYAVAYRR